MQPNPDDRKIALPTKRLALAELYNERQPSSFFGRLLYFLRQRRRARAARRRTAKLKAVPTPYQQAQASDPILRDMRPPTNEDPEEGPSSNQD